MEDRLKKLPQLIALQKTLAPHTAILLSRPNDLTYFLSIHVGAEERECFSLITKKSALVIHSPLVHVGKTNTIRYIADLSKPGWSHAASLLTEKMIAQIQVDEADVRVRELKSIKKLLKIPIKPLNRDSIWKLRMVKSALELKKMRRAGVITARALAHLRTELLPGMTEVATARRLEAIMFELGANATAFPTIVAFGTHTANPHHTPSTRALAPETPVLIDCGAKCKGYCSDITRTFWFGETPSDQFIQIQDIVQQAYDAGLALLKKKTSLSLIAQEVDAAVRQFIHVHNFGTYFIHSTGHGLGIDIHEPPAIAPRDNTTLRPSMVITIEPGIYLPTKLGYRHENTILLSKNGVEILTEALAN
ncbi:M24 family metallopeptidase [Candidatus Woesebacteria bacterium]|nr:M24 family metallopeptidase [Candidatus Woesebacteria bacterium]